MAALVYGLFDAAVAAKAATAELTRNAPEHPAFLVQIHTRGPLNGDDMPEAATETGRNTIIAMIAGGIIGCLLGVLAGATLDIMGLNVAIGGGFGLLTGVLSGLLCGMMAGTRRPKAALRAAAERLDGEKVLLTIEVSQPEHADLVASILHDHGAIEFDRC